MLFYWGSVGTLLFLTSELRILKSVYIPRQIDSSSAVDLWIVCLFYFFLWTPCLMCRKSVYLKQVGLIVFMAHIGIQTSLYTYIYITIESANVLPYVNSIYCNDERVSVRWWVEVALFIIGCTSHNSFSTQNFIVIVSPVIVNNSLLFFSVTLNHLLFLFSSRGALFMRLEPI